MPTKSATEAAATAANDESEIWAAVASGWIPDRHPTVWDDLPATESAVITATDAGADLERRAVRWGYPLGRGDLTDLARFAAALAQTEAEAWLDRDRSLATRALEARRLLAADRILPWAVPWLLAAARCFPDVRDAATETAEALLAIGDRYRSAPQLTGREGLVPPGFDGYGPKAEPSDLRSRVASLWGGLVVFRRSLESIAGHRLPARYLAPTALREAQFTARLGVWYDVAAARWRRLAEQHAGTAGYWIDLADRAARTAEIANNCG